VNRSLVALAVAITVLGGGALAVRAEGGLTITPGSGPPGTNYEVAVDCGSLPEVRNRNTQDGPAQGTIAPLPENELEEIAPSTWVASAVASNTDDEWGASCSGEILGSARFDAESPHLWFGPRPTVGFSPIAGRTTVEGTDCPPGTTATVGIAVDDIVLSSEAAIDQYGDWSVPLPFPVGQADLAINARCGDVVYETLTAEAVDTTPPTTESAIPPTSRPPQTPAPAVPQAASPSYTG